MRAVGYVRVSTEEQADEGYSLAAQRKQIAAYCEAKNWELGLVYADEGISGKETKNRPALQQMLAAARAHDFDVVVVSKLDRLSRTTMQLLALVQDCFTGNSVRLVSVGEGIDPTSATGQFVMTILAGLAQMEREQIGERTRMGMAEAKAQGKHVGKPPYGWCIGDDGRLVAVPEQQEMLLRAVNYTGRHGIKLAAQLLGWPLSSLKDRLSRFDQQVFKPKRRKALVTEEGAALGQPGAT